MNQKPRIAISETKCLKTIDGLTAADRTAHEVWRLDVVDVAEELDTDLRIGLTSIEVAARLASDGPNTLDAAVEVPMWRKFLAQFVNPLVYLLLAAVVVSLVAWTSIVTGKWNRGGVTNFNSTSTHNE